MDDLESAIADMERWSAAFRPLIGYEWAPLFFLAILWGIATMLIVSAEANRARSRQNTSSV